MGFPGILTSIHSGRAQWTYVNLGKEGDNWREVTSGISEGDTVADTGNTTLAHTCRSGYGCGNEAPYT